MSLHVTRLLPISELGSKLGRTRKFVENKQVEAYGTRHLVPGQAEAFLPDRSAAELGKEHAKFQRWLLQEIDEVRWTLEIINYVRIFS
jgi:hypothetical protein